MKAAVVGLWHQGVVGAACLTELGFDVTAADFDAARISNLSKGRAPLFEPGLDELVAAGLKTGRLRFTTDLAEAVADRELIFWMFDTSVDENDESDLSELFHAARTIAPAIVPGAIILSSAQVAVGTMDLFLKAMRDVNPRVKCSVAYIPENLRLGEAIERFRHPPLPILGSDDKETLERLVKILKPISSQWRTVSLRTAEMMKHALNAYLAATVTFANELGNMCDEVGADGKVIGELLRLDPRIGPRAMLSPGLGFAGGTLARDVQTLRGIGDRYGIETPLLDGLWVSNEQQNKLVVRRLKSYLGELPGRSVAILGLTYKPGTSTLRRSAAIEIANDLLNAGVAVIGHDPKANWTEIASVSKLDVASDPYEAIKGSDAVVLMTPWPEYRDIELGRVREGMRGNLLIDTAGLWSHDAARAANLNHWDIGRGRAMTGSRQN
jgi:UDPglucose 6-dehydrogenase